MGNGNQGFWAGLPKGTYRGASQRSLAYPRGKIHLPSYSLELTISLQYDVMCNRFSEMEKQRCVTMKNN